MKTTLLFLSLMLATQAYAEPSQSVVAEYHFDEAFQATKPSTLQTKAAATAAPVHAVIVHKATWTTNGFIGGAYEFKGNGMIKIEGFNQPSETGEISLSVWVKPSIDLKKGVKRNQFTSDCWGPHQMEYAQGGLVVSLYDEKHTVHRFRYLTTLEKDKWHHLAFTAKAGHQVRMFINGDRVQCKLWMVGHKEVNQDTTDAPEKFFAPDKFDKQTNDKQKRLHIGAEGYNRWYLHGTLDELTIWSREIPPGQMKQIYKDAVERRGGKK